MTFDFSTVDHILTTATPAKTPAAQLVVRWRGQELHASAYGWIDPDTRQHRVTLTTRFDLASLTKLFTTTAFVTLVEAGRVSIDQPVGTILSKLNGVRPVQPYEHPLVQGEFIAVPDGGKFVDAGTITFRHLLTHTSGLPAWRPLFRQPDAKSAQQMVKETFFACQPGDHVIYSDAGLILLGMPIERLTGQRLDRAIHAQVAAPLGLHSTGYQPVDDKVPSNDDTFAPTEWCAWRERRVVGQVHDENAYQLNGLAGHAGLFSTAHDVARLGQIFLDDGAPLLAKQTVAEMVRVQATEEGLRRGLGFVRWTPELDTPSFSDRTVGHTGFTGTSLWIDPSRDLVVALLTNEVYHGRDDRKIAQIRNDVHGAILTAVDDASIQEVRTA